MINNCIGQVDRKDNYFFVYRNGKEQFVNQFEFAVRILFFEQRAAWKNNQITFKSNCSSER